MWELSSIVNQCPEEIAQRERRKSRNEKHESCSDDDGEDGEGEQAAAAGSLGKRTNHEGASNSAGDIAHQDAPCDDPESKKSKLGQILVHVPADDTELASSHQAGLSAGDGASAASAWGGTSLAMKNFL